VYILKLFEPICDLHSTGIRSSERFRRGTHHMSADDLAICIVAQTSERHPRPLEWVWSKAPQQARVFLSAGTSPQTQAAGMDFHLPLRWNPRRKTPLALYCLTVHDCGICSYVFCPSCCAAQSCTTLSCTFQEGDKKRSTAHPAQKQP
jgi:hypothetical protein